MNVRLLIVISLFAANTYGQDCPDTLSIEGYFVMQQIPKILEPTVIKKGNKTIYGGHLLPRPSWMFLPKDSLTKAHPLSYWLEHFNPEHMGVYGANFYYNKQQLKKYSCPIVVDTIDHLKFPGFDFSRYYQVKGKNDYVYGLFYVNADWARLRINKKSLDGTGADVFSRSAVPGDSESYILNAMYHLKELVKEPEINDSALIMRLKPD